MAQNKPRALIQMATGSGKTFTAISFIYLLIPFAGARRGCFWWTAATLAGRSPTPTQLLETPATLFIE